MDEVSTPFRHGVASGDPTGDAVVIWTRVTAAGVEAVPVAWWVEPGDGGPGSRLSGSTVASPDRDWTVAVDVGGLAPGRRYRYGFTALGASSAVGRTRTLPRDDVTRLRLAQVSCAKFNAGFFNAYARVAERDDLDAVVHLGDYIYEASNTPPRTQTPGADIGRPFDPIHECRTLADYRRRYAQYRADPDAQAMHAAHPLFATIDDHELADGAWRDGADNHDEVRDGPWSRRRADAFRARSEWLPIRPPDPADPSRTFRTVRFGALADLLLIDTRSRRDRPVPAPAMLDPDRTPLGAEQRDWLFGELGRSTARWRLLGNPSVMARTWNDALPDDVRHALVKLKLIDGDAAGPDHDQWDGYPAERERLLARIRDTGPRNVVVLSGDVHVGLAAELAVEDDGDPVAVEFVNASLTSQNLDDKMGWSPLVESLPLAAGFVAGLPHIQWADFDSHGYSVVEVMPDQVAVEWWAVDGVLQRQPGERCVARWGVRHGVPQAIRLEVAGRTEPAQPRARAWERMAPKSS